MRSASARRPWYARARALFSSVSELRNRRQIPARSRLSILALEDRVYPSITPLGEFGVATTTANDQQHPAIAADGSGNFLVAWEGPRPEGGNGIYWQRFDISGTRQGGEVRANENPWGEYHAPAVAMAPDGWFVVSWYTPDGANGNEVFARVYDAAGVPTTSAEFRVNAYSDGSQTFPAVAMAADHTVLVAFQDDRAGTVLCDIFARRFDAYGNGIGAQFQVNVTTAYHQYSTSVGIDAASNFVIGWSSQFQDGFANGVFARTFAADATPTVDHDIQLNAGWMNDEMMDFYGLGVAADGSFAAAWQSGTYGTADHDMFARRFAPDGSPMTDDLPVNTYTTGLQAYGSVAVAPDGSFAVTWVSDGQDGSGLGVYAQQFSSEGTKIGDEIRVNERTNLHQDQARIAADGKGNFVAAFGTQGMDGSGRGVAAGRLGGYSTAVYASETTIYDYAGETVTVTSTVVGGAPGADDLLFWRYHVVNDSYSSLYPPYGLTSFDLALGSEIEGVANVKNTLNWEHILFGSYGQTIRMTWMSPNSPLIVLPPGGIGDFSFTTPATYAIVHILGTPGPSRIGGQVLGPAAPTLSVSVDDYIP